MQGASAGQEVPGEGVDGSRILQIEGAGLHPGQPGQVGPRRSGPGWFPGRFPNSRR
jgi:hypothetical protein